MSQLNQKLLPFQRKLDNVVTDLLTYGNYQDFMNLQNPETCGEVSLLLEEDLGNMNQVQLDSLAVRIVGKQTKCSTKNCPELQDTKLGKQQKGKDKVCRDISIFYVRILNIITAILVAVDTDNNMCLRRLKALFDTVDNESGEVTVCENDPKLYPNTFLKLDGMKELLHLYTQYNIEGNAKVNEEKKREIQAVQLNIKKIFRQRASDSSSESNARNNDNVMSNTVKKQIEKLESNVSSVKNRLGNMANIFRKKGLISEQNAQNVPLNSSQLNSNEGTVENTLVESSENPKSNADQPPNNLKNNTNTNTNTNNNNTNNETATINNLNNENTSSRVNVSNIRQNNENKAINANRQNGGKTKRKKRQSNKKKSKRKQKGGAALFRALNPFKSRSNQPIKNSKLETNNVLENRSQKIKKVKDLQEVLDKNKVPVSDIVPQSSTTIGYVPTNLSQTAECKSGKLRGQISRSDTKLNGFFKKYGQFENHYYKSSTELLNMLDTLLLKQNDKGRYQIKNFNSLQLDEVEKKVRLKLLEYYTKCQELFTESFLLLSQGVGVDSNMRNENVEEEAANINDM